MIFKPVLEDKDGRVKGNVDAELVLQAMIDFPDYDKAAVVSSDGDFHCLLKYLYKQNKLKYVLSPYRKTCSILLKQAAQEKIFYMDNLRRKLEFKKRKDNHT